MDVGAGISSGPQSQAGDGPARSSQSWAPGAPGTPSSRSDVHRALVDGLSHDSRTDQRSAVAARGRTPRLSRYCSNLVGLASVSAKLMYPSGRTKYTAPRFTPA